LAQHLRQHSLDWPQLLASVYENGRGRMMFTSDAEGLDALMRTIEKSKGFQRHRDTASSVTLTCYGGVCSDLPQRALQILDTQGIAAEKTILSPHSITVLVPTSQREAAVKALHSLV